MNEPTIFKAGQWKLFQVQENKKWDSGATVTLTFATENGSCLLEARTDNGTTFRRRVDRLDLKNASCVIREGDLSVWSLTFRHPDESKRLDFATQLRNSWLSLLQRSKGEPSPTNGNRTAARHIVKPVDSSSSSLSSSSPSSSPSSSSSSSSSSPPSSLAATDDLTEQLHQLRIAPTNQPRSSQPQPQPSPSQPVQPPSVGIAPRAVAALTSKKTTWSPQYNEPIYQAADKDKPSPAPRPPSSSGARLPSQPTSIRPPATRIAAPPERRPEPAGPVQKKVQDPVDPLDQMNVEQLEAELERRAALRDQYEEKHAAEMDKFLVQLERRKMCQQVLNVRTRLERLRPTAAPKARGKKAGGPAGLSEELLLKWLLGLPAVPVETAEPPPDLLEVPLMPHQKFAVRWMLAQEQSPYHGGLLADEMGLGKTVELLGLIVAAAGLRHPKEKKEKEKDQGVRQGPTLIIAPVSLLSQWLEELKAKAPRLRPLLFHGPRRAPDFASADVVLTTYDVVAGEVARGGCLANQTWARVIAEEGHLLANPRAKRSKAAHHMRAECRWVVTGTPLQNGAGDLVSYLAFLRVKPFDQAHTSAASLMKSSQGQEMLKLALSKVVLRRTKAVLASGLPPRHLATHRVLLSPAEQSLYRSLLAEAAESLAQHQSGPVLLMTQHLRLMQALTHPLLIPVAALRPGLRAKEIYGLETSGERGTPSPPDETQTLTAAMGGLRLGGNLTKSTPTIKPNSTTEEQTAEEPSCPICLGFIEDGVTMTCCGSTVCQECQTESCPCGSTLPQVKLDKDKPTKKERQENSTQSSSYSSSTEGESTEDAEQEEEQDKDEDEESGPAKAKSSPAAGPFRSAKLAGLLALLREVAARRERIVVYSQWTRMLDLAQAALRAEGAVFLFSSSFRPFRPPSPPGLSCERLDGTLSQPAKAAAVARFTTGSALAFLISLKAGGVGLNLTQACHVAFLDLWWNPAIEEQDRPVTVHKFIVGGPDNFEERVLAKQQEKLRLAGRLLDGDTAGIRRVLALTAEDYRDLFKL